MSVAHYFTFLRILISPLFPLFYLGYETLGIPFWVVPYILLALWIICESSDVMDGMIARRRHEVSDLGKVLDPMADSITRISLFFTFTQGIVGLPLLVVLVFLYRDFLISTLRTVCALKGVALAARTSGKLKAVLQAMVAFLIICLMIPTAAGHFPVELFQKVSFVSVTFAAIYTALSAGDYLYANRLYIRKALYRS